MTDDTKKEEAKEIKDSKESKVSKNVEKLVDEVAKLSVMELSELVNALQDKLGVSAAAPIMATSNVAGAAESQAGESTSEAQSASGGTQTVVMTASGDQKIAVIKALREINQNWGLKEAKDMTEATPVEILKDAKADDAKAAAEKLKAAGATVELK
jgi:large subunit ribosomal protein L7/L12